MRATQSNSRLRIVAWLGASLLAIGTGKTVAAEMMVTVQRIAGNAVYFVKNDSGTDGSSSGGMRAGNGRKGGSGSGGGKGRGRGKGRFGGSSSNATGLYLAPNVRVTHASYSRRTQEFSVGQDIAGGVRNSLIRQVPAGTMARLVSSGTRVIELNIVTDDMTIANQIAVKPKRPPIKR